MTYETEIYAALGPLVAGRAYPDTFPQDVLWPAIRYVFIDATPDAVICGSGGDAETDYRIQVDAIAKTGGARDALRIQINAAMAALPTPTTCEQWSKDYDPETKGYRVTMDFFLHPSSAVV